MLLCIGVLKLTIVNMKKTLIHNNLREYRKRMGLTQTEVANHLGFKSNNRISHWEKGIAVPSLKNAFKLAVYIKQKPRNYSIDISFP